MSDTAAAKQQDLIETLAEALTTHLKLVKVDTLDQLLEPASRTSTARFLLRPQLRANRYFDLALEQFRGIFIFDGWLGTVGIVDLIEFTGQPDERLEQQVYQLVDRAAQFRQILLLDAEERNRKTDEQKKRIVATTVELVLVLNTTANPSADPVGAALTKLARETTYLRSIGVSVLYAHSSGFERGDLRRALPWLLTDTREWYLQPSDVDRSPKLQNSKPWKLCFERYRLSGYREIHFAGGCTLHVVHGYNGSGKSTISEAFELLLTGYVERLEDAGYANYYDVVRHKPTQNPQGQADDKREPAQLILYCDEKETHRMIVSTEGRSQGLITFPSSDARPPAAFFRLDQRFMDKLITSRGASRYELFMRSFFPNEYPLLKELDKIRDEAMQALGALPNSFSLSLPKDGDVRIQTALARLQWTQEPVTSWQSNPLGTMESVLPITVTQVRLLARLNPTLENTLKRWDSEPSHFQSPKEELLSADMGLESLAGQLAQSVIPTLKTAQAVLKEFENWEASAPAPVSRTFEQSVDDWLETEALSDLIGKYYDVTATLQAARVKGWKPSCDEARLLPEQDLSAEQITALLKAKQKLIEDKKKARDAVAGPASVNQRSQASSPSGGSPEPIRRMLRDNEITALNTVGAWLETIQQPSSQNGLGKLFADALRTGAAPTLPQAKTVKIGSVGGLTPALEELQRLIEAATAFGEAWRQGSGKLEGQHQRAIDAWLKLSALKKKQEEIGKRFGEHVREERLNAAINELLALFKPASWAYQDITLKMKTPEPEPQSPPDPFDQNAAIRAGETTNRDRGEFQLLTRDGSPAELRLNTAALNSFVVALFMLCAPRVDNPLRLLVLDDPLQNMDEMTVNALSRGLAKLGNLLPDGWKIVTLFHGEEDLDRIREETRSAVYRLPWLTTRAVDRTEPEVTHDKALSNWEAGMQNLRDLIALTP